MAKKPPRVIARGDVIVQLRAAQGFANQEAFAFHVGIDPKTLSEAENGKEVSPKTINAILNCLKQKKDDLRYEDLIVPAIQPQPVTGPTALVVEQESVSGAELAFTWNSLTLKVIGHPDVIRNISTEKLTEAWQSLYRSGTAAVDSIEKGSIIVEMRADDDAALSLIDDFLRWQLQYLGIYEVRAVTPTFYRPFMLDGWLEGFAFVTPAMREDCKSRILSYTRARFATPYGLHAIQLSAFPKVAVAQGDRWFAILRDVNDALSNMAAMMESAEAREVDEDNEEMRALRTRTILIARAAGAILDAIAALNAIAALGDKGEPYDSTRARTTLDNRDDPPAVRDGRQKLRASREAIRAAVLSLPESEAKSSLEAMDLLDRMILRDDLDDRTTVKAVFDFIFQQMNATIVALQDNEKGNIALDLDSAVQAFFLAEAAYHRACGYEDLWTFQATLTAKHISIAEEYWSKGRLADIPELARRAAHSPQPAILLDDDAFSSQPEYEPV